VTRYLFSRWRKEPPVSLPPHAPSHAITANAHFANKRGGGHAADATMTNNNQLPSRRAANPSYEQQRSYHSNCGPLRYSKEAAPHDLTPPCPRFPSSTGGWGAHGFCGQRQPMSAAPVPPRYPQRVAAASHSSRASPKLGGVVNRQKN
jgi:hypothetical protein